MANDGKTIIPTPTWVLVVRIFQIILSIIVIGISGWFIHGLYLSSLGFAIVCCLFTWIIVVYALVTEKVATCHAAYNTFALLALDALMIIFWLSCMGAIAAARAAFNVDVNATCYSDGSAVNSGQCIVSKRGVGVATKAALAAISGAAGVSAIEMLLFIATFAYVCRQFHCAWVKESSDVEKQANAAPAVTNTTVQYPQAGVEMQPQQVQPLLNQQQPGAYPAQQQPPKWADAQGYPQQQAAYPQAEGAPAPQYAQNQPYDPYVQQNTAYTGAYSPNNVGQHQ